MYWTSEVVQLTVSVSISQVFLQRRWLPRGMWCATSQKTCHATPFHWWSVVSTLSFLRLDHCWVEVYTMLCTVPACSSGYVGRVYMTHACFVTSVVPLSSLNVDWDGMFLKCMETIRVISISQGGLLNPIHPIGISLKKQKPCTKVHVWCLALKPPYKIP